jgi:CBS-domain-containing membrane protein
MQTLITRFGLENRLRKENLKSYLLQCTLAAVAVLILLLMLDAVTQTVLIAALGASTFIAFAVPRSLHSDPRHMIGGYLVGILAGGLLGTLNSTLQFDSVATAHTMMVFFSAIATGLAMFIMVLTKTEHPPAAALALGLVLNEWDLLTLTVVIAGVVALSAFKRLVLPLLMDLL